MNSTVTYSVPATTSSISLYNPDTCTNSSYIRLWNNTCVTKYDAQVCLTKYKLIFLC